MAATDLLQVHEKLELSFPFNWCEHRLFLGRPYCSHPCFWTKHDFISQWSSSLGGGSIVVILTLAKPSKLCIRRLSSDWSYYETELVHGVLVPLSVVPLAVLYIGRNVRLQWLVAWVFHPSVEIIPCSTAHSSPDTHERLSILHCIWWLDGCIGACTGQPSNKFRGNRRPGKHWHRWRAKAAAFLSGSLSRLFLLLSVA